MSIQRGPLRVGVIGLGAFGVAQIEGFQALPGVEVVAVASRTEARARDIASRFGVPRWTTDVEALCRDEGVDAVTAATEENRHVAPCLAALSAGKHVLVEKPLATSSADAVTIRDAARASTARLMPGHIVRFESRLVALQRRNASGGFGQIAAIRASRHRPRATLATYARTHLAMVTAIHDIDICLWLLGERPERVRAWHRLEPGNDGVHGIWGTFTFPSGALAMIEATWMQPDDTGMGVGDTLSLTGTLGSAQLDMGQTGIRMLGPGQMVVPDVGYQPDGQDGPGGALLAELAHFALIASRPEHPQVVSVDDGVNAVVAAEAMVASATRNEEIQITWPR